jgi:FixJ family two-component response regulator
VTDVVMPDMNGREMMDQLHERSPDIPAIFMSGYTDDVILRHGIKNSEVDFLPKPFRIDDLIEMVNDVMERHSPANAPRGAPPTGEPLVLVIEDNTLLRKSLEVLLEDNDCGVKAAQDGEQGLDLFRAHARTVKCVLLDLNLPGMSGKEVHEVIRGIPSRVPIYILSGLDSQDIAEHVTLDEVTGAIQKPFDTGLLIRAIRETIRTGTVSGNGDSRRIEEA